MSLLRLALLVPAIVFVAPAHADTITTPVQIVRRSTLEKMIHTFARRAELQRARARPTVLARR